jgi:hypothetical protein
MGSEMCQWRWLWLWGEFGRFGAYKCKIGRVAAVVLAVNRADVQLTVVVRVDSMDGSGGKFEDWA